MEYVRLVAKTQDPDEVCHGSHRCDLFLPLSARNEWGGSYGGETPPLPVPLVGRRIPKIGQMPGFQS